MARTQRLVGAALLLLIPSVARGEPPRVKPETIHLVEGRYEADLTDGGHAALTLDPRLQVSTEDLLRAFQIRYAGAVVVSIPDGRVLALVGHSSADPRLGAEALALHPWAPSASVFKVVSATALVQHGVSASTRVCYHGGVSAVLPDNLVDIPALDRRCDTLGYGLGKSQNAIIAKLVTQHLTADDVAHAGETFGFGETIPFEIPVEPSQLDVPADARAAARRVAGRDDRQRG